jgi:hypothetical protein
MAPTGSHGTGTVADVAEDDGVRACGRCGAPAPGATDGLPAGWSLATERRGVLLLCATCTRANLRAIEGRLGEEWWDG